MVLRSEDASVKVGDYLYGHMRMSILGFTSKSNSLYQHNVVHSAFQQYCIRQNLQGLEIVKNDLNLPLSVYLGVCGMPGESRVVALSGFCAAMLDADV